MPAEVETLCCKAILKVTWPVIRTSFLVCWLSSTMSAPPFILRFCCLWVMTVRNTVVVWYNAWIFSYMYIIWMSKTKQFTHIMQDFRMTCNNWKFFILFWYSHVTTWVRFCFFFTTIHDQQFHTIDHSGTQRKSILLWYFQDLHLSLASFLKLLTKYNSMS